MWVGFVLLFEVWSLSESEMLLLEGLSESELVMSSEAQCYLCQQFLCH